LPPTLSQNEVDALMDALQDGQIDSDTSSDDDRAGADDIKAFDLTSRDRIVRGRMPTLDVIHWRLAHQFGRRLGTLLRSEVELLPETALPMKLGEFLSYQASPACINLLSLSPLQGTGLFCIQADLFYLIFDAVLGGPGLNSEQGAMIPGGRDFTAVELDFASDLVRLFSQDAQSAWEEVYPLEPAYLQTEVSPDQVSTGTASDVMMTTTFQVKLGNREGKLDLALPYSSLEPIKSRLLEQHMEETAADRALWKKRLREAFDEVRLELCLELGRASMSLSDLLHLAPGDIVRLDSQPEGPLSLNIEKRPKAWVSPLEVSGNLGFEFQEWRDDD
jgi:flagellar motor switch protein FliM